MAKDKKQKLLEKQSTESMYTRWLHLDQPTLSRWLVIDRPSLGRWLLQELSLAAESVGAWFLTIFCLAVMAFMVKGPMVKFYIIITYATALSLMIAPPLHTILAEFLGEQIFVGKTYSIVNGMLSSSILTVLVVLPFSAIIVSFSEISFGQKILFVMLTTLFSLLWDIVSLLAILEASLLSFLLFFAGLSTCLVLARTIGGNDLNVLLLIFIIGITIPIAGGYGYVLKVSLRQEARNDWKFIYRSKAIKVGLAFFLLNLGFWIDKFIFWFSRSTGELVDPLFRHCPEYDYPFFVAFSCMIIALFIGYRKIKHKVKLPFQAFVFKLNNNYPFWEIDLEKTRIVNGSHEVISDILLFYGGIVVFILFLVSIGLVPIPWANPQVFYYLLVGTIFYALYFFSFLILQHLDDYGLLLKIGLLFVVLNVLFTFLSIKAGSAYYGAGFMTAAIFSSLGVLITTNSKMGALEYEVFRKASRA